jgi:hypothetical protein
MSEEVATEIEAAGMVAGIEEVVTAAVVGAMAETGVEVVVATVAVCALQTCPLCHCYASIG